MMDLFFGALSPAGRLEVALDLYAPMDDEGVRHPECGIIDRATFLRLIDSAESASDVSATKGADAKTCQASSLANISDSVDGGVSGKK